jgi:hypothetical protein
MEELFDPSRRNFSIKVRRMIDIDTVMYGKKRIPIIALRTLKEKNPDLHKALSRSGDERRQNDWLISSDLVSVVVLVLLPPFLLLFSLLL